MTLGLDLSESIVRAVVVNDAGEVVARSDQSSAAGLRQAARQAVRRVRAAVKKNVKAAGVATTFPGDGHRPDVAAAIAESAVGNPVGVSSGAASALAEVWCGAARGLENVASFTIGEHVTAGVIIDGQVLAGAHGYAGSVSWLALNPVEREDYRRFGALEAEVAAAGIVRRLVWRVKSGDSSVVVDRAGGDYTRVTAEMVFEGARQGDGVCVSVVRDTARYVGMAVSNLATVLDPDAIVLGGSLATSGDIMLEAIQLECQRRLNPSQVDRVRIVLSTLGTDAVAIGAARAAILRTA